MDKDMFKSPFFTFLDPVLKLIDDGQFYRKPFKWLYVIISVLNLLIPIAVLATAIRAGIFNFEGIVIFGFILMFVVVCGLSWFGAQIWWNRSIKVSEIADDNAEFVAIPVFSHFVQTFGEWMGMWIGVGGFFVSLIVSLFMAGYSYEMAALRMGGMAGFGLLGCIINPIYGFISVVVARVVAEMLRALAAIANNTKKEKDIKPAVVTEPVTAEVSEPKAETETPKE